MLTSFGNNKTSTMKSQALSLPRSQRNVHTTHAMADSEEPYKTESELDYTFVGRSGGDIFHEMMIRHNIRHIFGYPGGAILPIYDALHASPFVEIILPRHEQGGGHMAEGYARATGRPAVVLVTSGPGATNTITALADAFADGVPIIVFTGQVAVAAQGTQAFQEVDMMAISRTCTKWQTMVKNLGDLPGVIDHAFTVAMAGRPGPVLVDLPKDVTSSILKHPISRLSSSASFATGNNPHNWIQQAAHMINRAQRPVILAGQGVYNNPDGPAVLAQLAHQGQIPVTTTVHALGAFDEQDPLALKMLGMHGTATANLAIQHADVIIAMGARLDDRVTMNVQGFAPEAIKAAEQGRGGILHFEINPAHIDLTVRATLAIHGDVTDNVRLLLHDIDNTMDREEWLDQIDGWKQQYPIYYTPATGDDALKPQQLITALDRLTKNDKHRLTITTGVGLHQMWTAQLLCWRKPRTMITSGSLGTMGYGVPSAIGVKLARPHHIVVDIDGDASFSMTAMELATAAQYNIAIKVLLLNNSFQAMVGQLQDAHYNKRYTATEMVNPDFIDLGKSMPVKGIRVTRASQIESAMAEFLAYDQGPVLMEAVVDKHERLYPTVLAGHSLDQFLVHPDLRD